MRACSRIKQANDLNFLTAQTISLLRYRHDDKFFMEFRGPKAHPNRPQKTMAYPTPVRLFFGHPLWKAQFYWC
jgi:hypothetical protein